MQRSTTTRTKPALTALLVLCVGASIPGCRTPTPATPFSDQAARPAVRIGVIGDQTASADLDASYAILEQGVELLSARELDVVLHVGDLVESSLEPAAIRARFAQAAAILDRLPVPWFLTAGDHDVSPPSFQPGSADRSREALFQELYGRRVEAFRERPYYSFDVRGIHFVALYSHQTLHADPRWGNVFLARIGDDQLAWLAGDLEAHRQASAVVVFLHQPLWYNRVGWRRVHELLRGYPVAAVVSGHFHYDQDGGSRDGIRYLTVGATGGRTKRGSRDAGDVHHVTVLRVGGPGWVDVELLALPGGEPLALTPDLDMDRVQALDVQLGNLWDFGARNPVAVEDGRLVSSCDGGGPARVRIVPLGNPIDLPLEVSIALRGEPAAVALDGPRFAADACEEGNGSTACLLPPGARTVVSNPSGVQVNGACPCGPARGCIEACDDPCAAACLGPEAQPLWESGLKAAGEPPAPGTVLRLDVRTAFTGTSGELYLERTVDTTVTACP